MQVEPGTYDAVIVMGATATADFLTGATADALRQDYLWQTKALINDTVVALQQTQLTKEPVAVDSSAAAAQEARGRPACADGARWKGQWRRIPNKCVRVQGGRKTERVGSASEVSHGGTVKLVREKQARCAHCAVGL